jgi:GT2 family glycosyltransferase
VTKATGGEQLSDSELEQLQVPLETATGENFNQIFEEIAAQTLAINLQQTQSELQQQRQLVQQLRDELQAIEIVRSRLTNTLHDNNLKLKQQVKKLTQSNKKLKRENQQLCQSVQHLEQEISYLSTGKAAVRQVVKTGLRKLRLFDFVYRRYQSFVPVYNLLLRDRWKPRTVAQPAPQQQPPQPQPAKPAAAKKSKEAKSQPDQVDLNATAVDALVVVRAMGFDVNSTLNTQTLTFFAELLAKAHHVLAVSPSQSLIPLLQAFSNQNAKLTCVACGEAQNHLRAGSVKAIASDLGEWMASAADSDLSTCDLLCLNFHQASESALKLLRGRLSRSTKVIVAKDAATPAQAANWFTSEWGAPDAQFGALSFYETPPANWQSPFWYDPPVSAERLWAWNYPTPKVAPTLPSGKPFPKISIVTVTLNQGDYLEETIRSVLLQGYPNLEYIVLDGGSTDQTPAILERYRHDLTYCISEPDEGQSNALNKGFRLATGDILAWLNSDDRYLPGTLFRVALAFDTYGSDLVSGGCQLIEGNQLKPFKTHHSALPIGEVVPLPLDRLLNLDDCWQKGEFFYQPEVFWTKEIWQRSGAALDEGLFYSMDYELWVRMAYQGGTIAHIPDPLILYRVHEQQKTYGNDIPYLPELRTVRDKFCNQVLQREG